MVNNYVDVVGSLKEPRMTTNIVVQTSATLFKHLPMMERASTARSKGVPHGKSCAAPFRVMKAKLFSIMAGAKLARAIPELPRVVFYACPMLVLQDNSF